MTRPKVIVCGTKFGRVYLSAFRQPEFPFQLAGILAKGSARSRACAEYYRVPLFDHPDQLPPDIDIACVVIGAGLNGGPGAKIAQALMARGVHILQEHPLHHDELVECFRQARLNNVIYRVNTHYIHLAPVRRFLAAAKALLHQQQCLFIDAVAGFQTSYAMLDILGRALGRLRPWSFAEIQPLQEGVIAADLQIPFRSLDGLVAGVPVTLRIQNQMDPGTPDNHSHIFHRITIGTASGNLILVNTHGPVIWCPQPHMPSDSQNDVSIEASSDCRLDLASATPIGAACAPSYREILTRLWPEGIARALLDVKNAIQTNDLSPSIAQHNLSLCRLWQDINSRLGPITLIRREPPPVFSIEPLVEAGRLGDGSWRDQN